MFTVPPSGLTGAMCVDRSLSGRWSSNWLVHLFNFVARGPKFRQLTRWWAIFLLSLPVSADRGTLERRIKAPVEQLTDPLEFSCIYLNFLLEKKGKTKMFAAFQAVTLMLSVNRRCQYISLWDRLLLLMHGDEQRPRRSSLGPRIITAIYQKAGKVWGHRQWR
jgi:hypothetical protein